VRELTFARGQEGGGRRGHLRREHEGAPDNERVCYRAHIGQILALASRQKSSQLDTLFPLRSEAGTHGGVTRDDDEGTTYLATKSSRLTLA